MKIKNTVKNKKAKSPKKENPTLEKRVMMLEKELQAVKSVLKSLQGERELSDFYNK